jgi:adenine-specific DNA methylase
MTETTKRLIEVAFPLEQTSLDSVHEKNVRHGHISTLHIWPARRPLAASRAALIATLLPDPANKEKRDEILKRLGGTVAKVVKKKKLPSGKVEEVESRDTIGGILHWGRESGSDLEWFRQEIRKAYGGRAPKVLDPFAGGGAIPLEAMRLGCDVTAVDINPVAWFILKCTLEYPQRLAGQKRPLPDFALRDRDFMFTYLESLGLNDKDIQTQLTLLEKKPDSTVQDEMFEHVALSEEKLNADLAWHVRAWGYWVLKRARAELARYYPTYAEFCSVKPYARVPLARSKEEQLKIVQSNDNGELQIETLNAGFDKKYLDNDKNPRWIAKLTAAYLWARTVKCKACRATVPLLKTRWLTKKSNKRVLLSMEPTEQRDGVVFGIQNQVTAEGGNAAQRREHDKRIGAGTMSRSGATCPCCTTIMTPEDLRLEGLGRRLGLQMTAVVCESPKGKEYRLPTDLEVRAVEDAAQGLSERVSALPLGLPNEPLPSGVSRAGGGSAFTLGMYGFEAWHELHTRRQLRSLVEFALATRDAPQSARYDQDWVEAIAAFLSLGFDKLADRLSTQCIWISTNAEKPSGTFTRFALPITWDFVEVMPWAESAGGYMGGIEHVAEYIEHALQAAGTNRPKVVNGSAAKGGFGEFDVIVTDPPYYDAIPYSDLMDYFYVWLRRIVSDRIAAASIAFSLPLGPKWSHEKSDGELIDDAGRFGGDRSASKNNYEHGMANAFKACHDSLAGDGRLVVVFAHKHPDAWETLVTAIIRAGFVVDGSWPIQTERTGRMRAQGSAALSSSVWLVCRKRDLAKRAGWDTDVLREMVENITQRLRDFWDAGIRGPDFVWAATGPALEVYSQYPAVKKATETGALMSVSEFLRHVRRIVVDFVVGRVLSGGQNGVEARDVSLDDATTYYLLHRNDFGLKDAPAGACILYAVSCGLSERLLADQYEILSRGKGAADDAEDDAVTDEEESEESVGSGGTFKLKAWNQRKNRSLGIDSENERPVPLIDQVHKLMQLWKVGDENKVNDYLEQRGLRRSPMFAQLVQALIEKSRAEGQGEECSLLEKLSNHLRKIGATAQPSLSLGA